MLDANLLLWIALLTALPFVLLYWIARYVSRRKQAALFRGPRPWQLPTLQRWVEEGWLDPQAVQALPAELSPAALFYEWAAADPEAARCWRFREPVLPETPLEAIVADAWDNLPAELRARSRERLGAAVQTASQWWGGVEQGWNGRPFALLAASVGKKQAELPLLPMDDLTAAPLPLPISGEMAAEGDGPELVLALAALRRAQGLFSHPLAPRQDQAGSMIQGLSTKVATDVGRKVGAGIGAVLGPIGSMIGQYLGGMAGELGGKAISTQMLPEAVQGALKETEAALVRLGELAGTDAFAKAAGTPAEAILEIGKRVEVARQDRSRGLRERLWPTPGLALVEEVLRFTLGELEAHRAAAIHFTATARKAPEAVAGGMILQNPWLVGRISGGPERLSAARQALNRAAGVIRRSRPG